MAKKTSDWKIIATAGPTVDGRAITEGWINDMAKSYSVDEYAALIWPEHSRSSWNVFDGKNWGIVEELKAEKRNGKLRLLAKITPNEYLLKANSDGQKLFTSIEPNPDYKGLGTCYLMGLAVTDSPASSGTTPLKFSKGSGDINLDVSQLEEINFSECFAQQSLLAKAFSTLADFYNSDGVMPTEQQQEEEPMDPKQFDKMFGKLESIEKKQAAIESANTALSEKVDKFAVKPELQQEGGLPAGEEKTFSAEQFSIELKKQLEPITDKFNALETKFNALSKEVPGQRPGDSGLGEKPEAF